MQLKSRSVLFCLFLLGFLNITTVTLITTYQTGQAAAQPDKVVMNKLNYLPTILRPTLLSGPTNIYLPAAFNALAHPKALSVVPFAAIPRATQTVTAIVHAGDDRLFVALREGFIYIVQPDGTVLPEPFLEIPDVALNNWEQGLLGLAFHPGYPTVPYFYVVYTYNGNQEIRLERYSVLPNNPNQADPTSAFLMMGIAKSLTPFGSPSPVHNGGDLKFGPDGYLYMSTGDGGPDPYEAPGEPGDPNNHGQREQVLLGKILRIDVNQGDGADCGIRGYAIPPDNPFVDGPGERCDEIFLKGFRNPWRFSFDRLTGDMYIGDVGEWEREEISFHPAGAPGGANYGWHCYEGTLDYVSIQPSIGFDCLLPQSAYTFPIWEYYSRLFLPDGGCSVIGGFVYRGRQFPELYQHYVFGDFCFGRLKVIYQQPDGVWEQIWTGDANVGISTFGEDVNGELYVGTNDNSNGHIIYKVIVP